MRSFSRSLGVLTGLGAGLIFLACVPLFTDGLFQTLSFSFKFDQTIAAGEEMPVHVAVFPEAVKLKKNFVRVSGRMLGDQLPESATLQAKLADPVSGKVAQRISLKLKLDEEGRFSASSKIKKNVKAGEMMTVTLEPQGADLAKSTELTVCIDLVKKKADLATLPACVPDENDSDSDAGDDPQATFSSLQNDYFTPTCSRGGCHASLSNSGGLSLEASVAYDNLVNAPSQQQPGLNRVTPNDPENSYIIKKLRGDADISGTRMPQGGPFLSDAEIDRFVRWIDSGAPND